ASRTRVRSISELDINCAFSRSAVLRTAFFLIVMARVPYQTRPSFGNSRGPGWRVNLFVGFWGQQELKPEITDEIGLIGTGGFKGASGHEEKDHRPMNLVASAQANRGFALGRMEGALAIELHVHLE